LQPLYRFGISAAASHRPTTYRFLKGRGAMRALAPRLPTLLYTLTLTVFVRVSKSFLKNFKKISTSEPTESYKAKAEHSLGFLICLSSFTF